MSKIKNKYYAVKVGRKPGIYTTWSECNKQVNKYPRAVFKSFSTLEEAEKFARIKGISKAKANKSVQNNIKICSICEKPHRGKNQCCASCSKQLKELKSIIEPFSTAKRLSISKVVNIKAKYKPNNVFEFIKSNPYVWKNLDSYKKRLEIKRNMREYHRSNEYRNHIYSKWEENIPMFVLELFKDNPTKKTTHN